MGLGAALYLRQSNRQQEQAALATPVPPIIPTATPSPTFTPIPPTATNTPEPTSTATLVVNTEATKIAQATFQASNPITASLSMFLHNKTPTPGVGTAVASTSGGEATAVLPPTPIGGTTVAPPTPIATTLPSQIPQGGGVLPAGDDFLIWAGLGVLVLLIIGAFNYRRASALLSKD